MAKDRLAYGGLYTPSKAINVRAPKLGNALKSLRHWYEQSLVDTRQRPGPTREEHEEIKRLKRENAELKRANKVLKLASTFFRNRTRLSRDQMIMFIDEYSDSYSVEFLCRVLCEHLEGGYLTSRGNRAAKPRPPRARALRDEVIISGLTHLHARNYDVYGIRKMWHAARRVGLDLGRDQVARSMKITGITDSAWV